MNQPNKILICIYSNIQRPEINKMYNACEKIVNKLYGKNRKKELANAGYDKIQGVFRYEFIFMHVCDFS